MCDFIDDLHRLCVKYDVFPVGNLRIRQGNEWDKKSFEIKSVNELNYGYAKDKGGPFILMNVNQIEIIQKFNVKKVNTVIQDKDVLLRDGVKSQVDGKMYTRRADYNDHLKRHDMVEVGDQAPTKAPKEIRGDFDCKKELHEAIKQHMG